MPSGAYEIEDLGNGSVIVHFFENVQEIEREETYYEYDRYQVETRAYQALNADIESDYDSWIELAKANEDVVELSDKEKVAILEQKNAKAHFDNAVQDEMIDLQFMATDELYTMIEPLLGANKLARTLENGGNNKMAEMYAAMVIRGLKTIDEVPARYREEVRKLLAELEA